MKKLALHWWILIALGLGVLYGYIATATGSTAHVLLYVDPFGQIFMNLLRMIAVPLVLFSLVAGAASMNDTAKMGRIGGKTIGLYVMTTAIAITIGLVTVNLIQPGTELANNPEIRERLANAFAGQAQTSIQSAENVSIIQQIVSIVPQNPFESLAESKMLQVVFFALLLGIALTRLPRERGEHIIHVFQNLSDAIIIMVQGIMKFAPIGVFALIASVICQIGKDPETLADLMGALGAYMGTVAIGLIAHMVLVYTVLLALLTNVPLRKFFRAIAPAQLLAFSSSSSGATLPVTMTCVEKGIGVDEEASSFILPIGATINMDGTGLYQGVAAVFICTVFGRELSVGDQLTIVLTATMASIGTAAVPGVGIVMLTIVLQQLGMANEMAMGIALILGVDRPLDMCRTVLNVTGDATVATVVASSEGLIHPGERHHEPS